MHQPDQSLWINARLATCDAANPAPYGALEGHALWLKDGRIHAVLPQAQALQAFGQAGSVHDAQGRWLTPGLVDCHTHLVYGGNRAAEWEKRLTGVPYQQIAAEGGGIISTVRATRSLDEDELALASLPRLKALMKEGVTTVEIKSGYGLTLADELKQLRAARRLAAALPVEVATTLLSAHALPPEYAGQADAYIDYVCHTIVPAAAAEGLAEAVDVFCEGVGFSPAQTRRVFDAARAHGLQLKGHVEQLSNLHGAALVAECGGLSADHIEYLDDAGVAAMAQAGHRGGAAAGGLLLPARNPEAAGRQTARGRCGDGGIHRPQPRHQPVCLAAAGDEPGLRAVRPDAGRSAAGCYPPRGAGAGARPQPRQVGRRLRSRPAAVGISSTRRKSCTDWVPTR